MSFVPTRPDGLGDIRQAAEDARQAEVTSVLRGRNTLEAWHIVDTPSQPAFQFSWGNMVTGDGSLITSGLPVELCSFLKDPFGFVHMKGVAIFGGDMAVNQVRIFTLPVGYRPPQRERFPSDALGVYIEVLPDGSVNYGPAVFHITPDAWLGNVHFYAP